MTFDVGLVGTGPAADAVASAVTDADARVHPGSTPDPERTLNVVLAPSGDPVFTEANRTLTTPWITVELGGIGGLSVEGVYASVAVLNPQDGCYDCLRTRVAATDPPTTSDPPGPPAVETRYAGAIAGRLAVRYLSHDLGTEPDPRGTVGTVIELPYHQRRLLPLPGCACTESPNYRVELDDDAQPDLETVTARAEAAIDDRLGPVTTIGEAHSYPIPYYLASLYDTTGFSDAQAARYAAGAATDWDHAFMKAVGEALERYAAGVYRTNAFTTASTEETDASISPDRFVTPTDAPTPDPDDPIEWIPGRDLLKGSSVLLPAEFVVFPPQARRFKPAITTGLGLGGSTVQALLSGLLETIERDAVMLAWYSTYEPLELAVANDGYEALARRARAEDLDVTSLLVTQDLDIPVVTACVHRTTAWPRFAVGAAAHLDPDRAAAKALEEALQNWMELRDLGPDEAANEPSAIARYAKYPPEAQDLVTVETTVPATSLAPEPTPAGRDALDTLLRELDDHNLTAYTTRLTTRDLEHLGFETVRVLVPDAQPLFFGDPFFGSRATTVPESLGFQFDPDRPPHPYP